jgi:hypothetical protein
MRQSTIVAVFLFSCAAGAAVLAQQGQSRPGEPPQQPGRDTSAQIRRGTGTGSISGQIVALDTGRPLKRVRVSLNAAELQGGRSAGHNRRAGTLQLPAASGRPQHHPRLVAWLNIDELWRAPAEPRGSAASARRCREGEGRRLDAAARERRHRPRVRRGRRADGGRTSARHAVSVRAGREAPCPRRIGDVRRPRRVPHLRPATGPVLRRRDELPDGHHDDRGPVRRGDDNHGPD